MYISEIKMHGFKSFANKEIMKLGQGITTVVGPNGCGKTNIVDAIRWVLGEQKYSVLRSGKMEDVIFNGAEGVKPLGVCEVSMTVHNNSGKLPIEYNDVEIARRVYRNGESEYFLNKTKCRLKDIMDLFLDTGMGADAYSVIELKMIEQILSDTAEDRRNMFEEAAGIHKYRSQRKSTIRKFDSTKIDLERINDIILEVDQKVNALSLQLKRFKRHSTLTEELETKDIKLAFLQIFRLKGLVSPLKEKIREYKHIIKSKSTQNSSYEKKLVSLRTAYKNQENELNKMQSFMNDLSKNREEQRNSILVLSEKGRGALLTIDRLEREKIENIKKVDNLNQLRLEFDKEVTKLEPSIDELLNKYKIDKIHFDKVEILFQKRLKQLDNLQNDRWESQRKLADERSFFDRTTASIDEKEINFSTTKSTIDKILQDLKIRKDSQSLITKNHSSLQNSLKKISNVCNEFEKKEKLLEEKKQKISKEKYSVSALVDSLKGQHLFYQDLVESKEGFPEGTRFVLENPKMFDGILGTVADMFQIGEEYRDALESGLGDLSHCLISDNKENALKTIKIASEKKIGDLTIIPLKETSSIKTSLSIIPNLNIKILRASDIVKTGKNIKSLAEYLLGTLLIVENLSEAIKIKKLHGWSLVDKSGAYSGKDLILKSRQFSEYGNLIGREEKLKKIFLDLKGLKRRDDHLNSENKRIDSKLKNNKIALKESYDKKKIFVDKITEINSNLLREDLMLDQLEKLLKTTRSENKRLKKDLKSLKSSIKNLQPKIKKIEDEVDSFKEKIDRTDEKMIKERTEKENFQKNLQDLRIQLIELESRRDQIAYKKKSGEETKEEINVRQIKVNKEVHDLNHQKSEIAVEIESKEKNLKLVNAEIQKQRSLLNLKKEVFRETYEELEQIQAKIASEQKNKEHILEELKNIEIESSKTEQQISSVKERISEKYNVKIPSNEIVDETEEQLELHINKIQRSLENIGPVNMVVQDEYNEENDRLEQLSIQRDDLIEAEENLRETIRQIDKVARKRFQETFDLIKSNFETLFNLFFEGGNASLKLVGDPDPLEADIGIDAQPPGKRNSSLRLLSSGEKALTAISLLFAIYQVKPSPYCILDEIDAPLDDINIHKFTKVLSKFCDETQFIIVTHNKLTMEKADYMYGVTQERKGISKLVSVKFD